MGSALTNPTTTTAAAAEELAFQKGVLRVRYPVVFANKRWPDVECAYLTLKSGSQAEDDVMMAELIA